MGKEWPAVRTGTKRHAIHFANGNLAALVLADGCDTDSLAAEFVLRWNAHGALVKACEALVVAEDGRGDLYEAVRLARQAIAGRGEVSNQEGGKA